MSKKVSVHHTAPKYWGMPTWLALFYIALFCGLGAYAWLSADDYSFINAVSDWGFIELQKIYYLRWTGRFFNTFLLTSATFLDLNRFYGVFPVLTALLYASAIYFFLTVLSGHISRGTRVIVVLWVQAVSFASLPALNETFYWMSGMPYTWTAAFLLLSLALMFRAFQGQRTKFALWGGGVLFFLNGAVLELSSVMQIVLAFLSTVYFFIRRDVPRFRRASFFLAVALLAFLVMFFAPGTTARMGQITAIALSSRLVKALGATGIFGFITLIKFFTKPVVYVFLLFLPDMVRNISPCGKDVASRLRMWHIFFSTALIAPMMQAIAGWATGAGLPARAESLTLWFMGAVWSCLWGLGYRQESLFERIRVSRLYAWRWCLLVLTLVLSPNFLALLGDVRLAPAYRAELRARDAWVMQQKEAGEADVVVPLLKARPKLLFFSDLRPWPSDWKNQAYARYHRIQTIRALPPSICSEERALSDFHQSSLEGLESLAAEGDIESQFLMGELYDTTFAGSESISKDDAPAAFWYLKAAGEGESHAQRRLARLYATGSGVAKDYLKAVYWLVCSQF